ncbi:ShlB/FhaC/HecB family hemolysin secretion/activation protein [Stakelama marina]|uniref:ShlB/FhaC/HecB family hemolysin secretion/activation protein n=1 Tax=Stakelama marina TaxID=2826939 RepID=A0A8T4IFC4_9SPHN|nr:ShlB/FhaC/HecB family hemolysin secretion/activation protein [Stakelama marina]MBR0551755.1 ShlB/FhaC/HecB family hemolysin secretion/activation protein [Stakelama marina]
MFRFRLAVAALCAITISQTALAQQVPPSRTDPGAVGRASVKPESREPAQDQSDIESSAQRSNNALTGVTVGAVHVAGAPDIDQAEFARAITPFVGKTFAGDDTQKLLSAISDVARNHGYIFATSSIPPQTLTAGVLTVIVSEGRIDRIRLEGQQRTEVAKLLNGLVGRPAREEQLDRALMMATDLPGIGIGKVRYSVEDGQGVLIVPVSYDRVRGWASVDNRGSEALGPIRAQVGVEAASLLAADDRVTLQGIVTPAEPDELTVLYGRYAYLLPDASTELALSTTYSRTNSGGRWESYDPRGNSIGFNASITKTLERGRRESLWASADFNYVKVNQSWNGTPSQRDRVASLGISLNGYTPLAGGRLRAGVGIRQGLNILGATRQGDPLASRDGAGSHYAILQAWTNWVGTIAGPVSARFAVTSQLSSDPLLAIDQITIGGPWFGRGYDFSERAGDEGALASAEIRTDLLDKDDGLLRWAQLYTFADAGVVRDLRDNYGTGDLYSAGAGARFKLANDLRVEVEAAFPINEPRYDAGDKSPRLSATVGIGF